MMHEDNELLRKRFLELARRADGGCYYTFTDFLGLYEQSVLGECESALRGFKHEAFGGVVGAERVMVRFGDPDEIGYDQPFPIVCIKAEPRSEKFADKLTHRDFLGAILNLGIERECLGDIAILDNVGYIFASEMIAPFIISSLERVKHTDVRLTVIDDIPEGELYRTELRRIQVSSERLDAVIARTYSLSRDDAQALFARKLVFVGGRLCESVSRVPRVGDKISVRGHGRFIYHGVGGTTKKGRLNVTVEVFL